MHAVTWAGRPDESDTPGMMEFRAICLSVAQIDLLLLTISQVLRFTAPVYSYQLIKLELLTQSIRQLALPPHHSGIRHSTRLSVWPRLQNMQRSYLLRIPLTRLRWFILSIFAKTVNSVFPVKRPLTAHCMHSFLIKIRHARQLCIKATKQVSKLMLELSK